MSSRTLDADLLAGSQSPTFRHVIFAELSFPSGTVRLHNSVGTLTFGGNDYLGVGAFGSIEAVEESLDLNAKPVSLILSSITPEIIDAVKADDVFYRDADIYLGLLNDQGQLLGTPDLWFSGFMETVEVFCGSSDGLKLTIMSRASKLNQRSNRRYTMEDHASDHTGDKIFEFLPYLMEVDVPWAGQMVRTGFTNTSTLNPNDANADHWFVGFVKRFQQNR